MSKAEELAKKYCEGSSFEDACMERPAYIAGYRQAEKDLLENKHEISWRLDEKLWKSIKDIEEASYQYMYDASNDWAYDIPTWEDVQDAFKAGSDWKEEQMMSKAIDGDITFDYFVDYDKMYGYIVHDSFCLEDFGLKDGDKVKVIIIKED